jgi:hypothetical protein
MLFLNKTIKHKYLMNIRGLSFKNTAI